MAFRHEGGLVASNLAAQDVDTLYPSWCGQISVIYDGCLDNDIEITDLPHEQAARGLRVLNVPDICVIENRT